MLVLETAFTVGMLCASSKRKRAVDELAPSYAVGNGLTVVPFRASNGGTLENKMTNEIEEMPGVVSVAVKRMGDTFDVSVVMENMDFDPFNAVILKKVDLYDKFPDYHFNFELTPADALPKRAMLALHAA
jgi:hypothetical protein